ncbi:GntR family transcriptional regulator [uncultured Leptotrichia sp.]|uniref:GntR family transcriptional regulator n=1 Tax=uncultured Leptotrichia sp. TaxID=159271 RepID=UPI00261F5C6B|nr:GntR family transcriptional regulator [uncultured Leptotrichia sp.]
MKKYEKVYQDIKEKIKNGELKPGDFLKKEDDLAEEYNFSKLTVRKALSMLETEGHIQKVKGKKSIVLEKKNLENISLTSIQTIQELNKIQNLHLEKELISLYIVQGVKELMDKFQVSENANFYKVVRTTSLNGEVLNYSTSFFDRRIVPFLNKEIAKNSIYEYLEKDLKLKIAYSRREIKFRKITSEEQKYFKLKDINMVVVIETHAYLSNGTLFQYETIIHHPEKFTFTAIAKR